MCKFIQLTTNNLFTNLHYIPLIWENYTKYFKYLQDDFSDNDINILSLVEKTVPYFWIIIDNKNQYMGFVFLDNFVGNNNALYSAELTTCFEKHAWGDFTKYSAKIFLEKCFKDFGFKKIKALIFPDNFRVKTLLKVSGFNYETTLKSETLRGGKPQDIEIYSLYKTTSEVKHGNIHNSCI